MSQSKNAFLLSYDFQEQIELLSDEEAGQVLKAIFAYCLDGNCPQLSPLAQLTFISMRQSIERFDKNYAKTVEKNRENGQKGGRPAKSEIKQVEGNPEKAVDFSENPPDILGFEKEPSENFGLPKKPYQNQSDSGSVNLSEGASPSPNLILNEGEPPSGSEIQSGVADLSATPGAEPPGAPPLRGDAQGTAKTSAKVEKQGQGQKQRQKLFIPPTVEQVAAFRQREGLPIDAAKFIDYYATRGWCVGKDKFPMKDWQKTVLAWAKREYSDSANLSPQSSCEEGANPDGLAFIQNTRTKLTDKFRLTGGQI